MLLGFATPTAWRRTAPRSKPPQRVRMTARHGDRSFQAGPPAPHPPVRPAAAGNDPSAAGRRVPAATSCHFRPKTASPAALAEGSGVTPAAAGAASGLRGGFRQRERVSAGGGRRGRRWGRGHAAGPAPARADRRRRPRRAPAPGRRPPAGPPLPEPPRPARRVGPHVLPAGLVPVPAAGAAPPAAPARGAAVRTARPGVAGRGHAAAARRRRPAPHGYRPAGRGLRPGARAAVGRRPACQPTGFGAARVRTG
jgi:hypothetical protein